MSVLTVSVPTYNTPPRLLARCLDGLLAQTVPDLRVVVTADGGAVPVLPGMRDPRVTVFTRPHNRGRYFADAVVLAALDPDSWFAVHDADDWAEREMYAELIAAAGEEGAATGPFWRHDLNRKPVIQQPQPQDPKAGFRHITHWCAGVTSVERARLAGGVHPGYRIGFDTLYSLMVALTGPVGVTEVARWHWQRRNGSLTRSKATHPGSVQRGNAKAALVRLYTQAWEVYTHGGDPGRVIRDDVPASLAADVAADADRLRALLDRKPHKSMKVMSDMKTHTAGPARGPRARAPEPTRDVTDDLVVTILTGGRPGLLASTLDSLRAACPPGTLDRALVLARVNGGDAASVAVLDQHRDFIDAVHVGPWEDVGPATSACAEDAQHSGRRFWLHLEDDWTAHPDPGWLDRAAAILDAHPDVGQVRLRLAAERVLSRHMHTRRPIRWQTRDGWKAAEAHLTFNPSLMRTADIAGTWPSDSERDAQAKRWKAGPRGVAQLVPGVFAHAGEGRTAHGRALVEGNTWALPDDALDALRVRLDDLEPGLVVEAGSGRSTYVLADCAGSVVTLEHQREFADRLVGLPGNVDVRVAPLMPLETSAGVFKWYQADLPDGVEFALIDGPPGKIGRGGALFALAPHLAPGAEVWLDDCDRPGEQKALAAWAEHLGATWERHPKVPRIAVVHLG